MAASDLNVRVGLDLRELRKSTKKMERMFQQTSDNLASIGNKMVLGITAPILGIGVAAIKAAGDMQALRLSLETTMGNAGYSIGQARNEMEMLREVGKNPGIDFEQAVKASLRLQGVGFSADRARVTIENLAKAIASAGGDPESLNRVTIQMAQMIGKGQVLASDLQVMKESLPSLATMMQKAFGPTTAEGIRDMGINADEFIRGITEEMKKMGPVSSGINNAIVNMFNSIKQFAAEIGEDLNKMFDISGSMDAFGLWVEGLAGSWRALSGETKETIIQIIAFAAALGPAFKAVEYGTIAIGAFRSAMAALKAAQMAASVSGGGLIATFKALDAATKATVIGAVVAVVLALGAAFLVTAKEATAAQIAQEKVISVQQDAAASAENESRKVNALTDVILNHKATLDQKRGALKELQKISPEYYGKFGNNVKDTNAIAAATRAYAQELIRLKTVEAAGAEIGKLKTELANLGNTTELSLGQSASAITSFVTSLGGGFSMSLNDFYNEQKTGAINKSTEAINAQIQALEGLIDENSKITDIVPVANKGIEGQSDALKEGKKQVKVYEEALSDVQNVMKQVALTGQQDGGFEDQVDAIDKAISKLLDAGYSPDSPKVKQFLDMMKALRGGEVSAPQAIATPELPTSVSSSADGLGALSAAVPVLKEIEIGAVDTSIKIDGLSTSFANMLAGMGASVEGMKAVGTGMAAMADESGAAFQLLADSAIGVEGGYTRMGAAALVAASKLVKAALAATIAKAIQDSMLKSGHPLLGVALAGIAVAGVTALFGRLEQSVSKTPKFAKGAMVYGPTSAIVGDNPGASVDPEVIAPLSKLKQYMGDGGTNITGNFKISGYDLVLAIEKNQRRQQRSR